MVSVEDRPTNLARVVVLPLPSLRSDLIRRPGEGLRFGKPMSCAARNPLLSLSGRRMSRLTPFASTAPARSWPGFPCRNNFTRDSSLSGPPTPRRRARWRSTYTIFLLLEDFALDNIFFSCKLVFVGKREFF